jgi:hypothetical protein
MKFHVMAKGDRTVGDGDHYACVDIPDAAEDAEYLSFVREKLTTCFSYIFDAKPWVLTDEEYQKEIVDESQKD